MKQKVKIYLSDNGSMIRWQLFQKILRRELFIRIHHKWISTALLVLNTITIGKG